MSQAEIEMSQAAVEPSTNAFSGVVDLLLESRIKLDPLENVLKETERNMKRITIYVLLIGLIWPFTQVARGQESGPVQPPPATMVEESQRSAGGASESDVATANNPIAPFNAIYLQNYYAPTVFGVPGSSNLLDLRMLAVSGRQIVRATLPISSAEDTNGNQQSGLGDFNVFDTIRVSAAESKNVLAVGPMLTAPTATNSFLGQGKWQAGLAAVGLHPLSGGGLLVGILTWQHSFAGEHSRPDAQGVTFQPIAALSIGGGYYVRSSGIWNFDISNNKGLIPLGVGFGKVVKNGHVLVNAFIEPQFTVYHYGTGVPSFQLFSGLNFQFRKKTD
ncbi:MAG TPA: hypothetical protein VNZ03_34905 [Terriglobales bacterium]|nr:hypothetical protein [Terriglobales bacterium]